MANIKELRQGGKSYHLADEQARQNIGDLSKLKTAAKGNLVDAVNEVKEQGGNDSGVVLGDTSQLIMPTVNENLINEEELIGGTISASGVFTESDTSFITDFIELQPNTDYQVYSSAYFVFYPEDKSFVSSNYFDNKKHHGRPYTFNTGDVIKYIRVSFKKSREWAKKYFLIKKEQYESCEDVKPYGKYFKRNDIEKYNFYKPVVYKLRDLYNIYKPTAICMEGDSITDPRTSYAYSNQFMQYVLDNFNDKMFQVSIFDEHVINCVEEFYPSGTAGAVMKKSINRNTGEIIVHDYLELSFYGSYFGVNTYAGQMPTVPVDVIIDGELYETVSFAENTHWRTEDLTMDYHTARVQVAESYAIPDTVNSVNAVIGGFEVKKYVTIENVGVWGSGSQSKKDRFKQGFYDEYDIIFLAIGTNDRGTEGFAGMYDFYIRQSLKHGLEDMGKEVIIMSETPSSREWIDDTNKHTGFYKMNDVVNWVNSIGAKDNEEIICFYHLFMNYADLTGEDIETLLQDGLHPNQKGHTLMFEHLVERCGWGKDNRKTFASTE